MINMLFICIGRLYIARKHLWLRLHGHATNTPLIMTSGPDHTGRVAHEIVAPRIILRTDDRILCDYPGMPWHSLWRSQEMSLLHRHRSRIRAPLLDYGCGDGSFCAAFIDTIEIGGDTDNAALSAAMRTGAYDRTVNTTAGIPLESGSVATVIANSVLEHVSDLHAALAEITRVLTPGGMLLMTVPTAEFTRQLSHLFGQYEADCVNVRCVHRHLPSRAGWIDAVSAAGLRPVLLQNYQPMWFTFVYHLLCAPLLNRMAQRFMASRRLPVARALSRLIVQSINSDRAGANVFIVAQKQ